MKFATLMISAACAALCSAADVTSTNAVRKLTPQEIAQKIRKGTLKLTGGRVRKPESAKGQLVVLNAQKTVDPAALERAFVFWDRAIKIQTALVPTEKVDVSSIKGQIAATGNKLGVALVDCDGLPGLLTAVEEGWAIVNVRALAKDAPSAEVLAKRTRLEMMRGFALVGGCACMARGAIVMRDVRSLAELDSFKSEDYGLEVMAQLNTELPSLGITPWYETTYKKACQEGWAAQPTNDYQKAIWEKIHALPSSPMKIEFDPKAGR